VAERGAGTTSVLMATEWHYARSASQVGPISTEDVKRRLVADGFPSDALVWRQGLENWQRPEDFPEFRRGSKPVPPPLPPGSVSANGKGLPMKILRLLFSFFGRINRAKYWLGIGIVYAFFFGPGIALPVLLSPNKIWPFILGLWMISGVISLLSIISKRLHDLSITAWWVPAVFVVLLLIAAFGVPLARHISNAVMGVLIIALGCLRGTRGPNRHGLDPLEKHSTTAQVFD
jgi:uncharacterized membrane protein YhaH (DUF805 family)